MFSKKNTEGYQPHLKGIMRKTLVYGEKTLLAQFHLEKGSIVPPHKHPYEQTGYMLRGKILFKEGDQECVVEEGDSWCFLANVEHAAEILEDSDIVELFSPVREDYLK